MLAAPGARRPQPTSRPCSVSAVDRYAPSRAIKLVGGAGGGLGEPTATWPLYGAQFLGDL